MNQELKRITSEEFENLCIEACEVEPWKDITRPEETREERYWRSIWFKVSNFLGVEDLFPVRDGTRLQMLQHNVGDVVGRRRLERIDVIEIAARHIDKAMQRN